MRGCQVISTLLLILCVAGSGFSQIEIGLIGGVNMANLSFDPEDDLDWSRVTVLGIGAIVEKTLGDQLSVQYEPMYLQKGSTADVDGIDGANIEIDLAYIEIPVMIKYTFPGESIKPYMMAGPTVGFNIKAEKVFSGLPDLTQSLYTNGTYDIKDDVTYMDFGLGFGAGICMPVGERVLFVQARYTLGLTNISNMDDDDDEVTTNGIQILGGIKIPLN